MQGGRVGSFMKKLSVLALSVAAVLASASFAANAGTLKIGATPMPHAEILEHLKAAAEAKGIDLQIIEFNDYVQPNLAADDGELDGNFFQHRPYLDVFVKDHGVNLVSVCSVHIEPMGVYSNKIKDLKDLKDGALVGIPNDPTNGGRSLLLLASAGLIKVANPNDVTTTVLDITENPKNLEFRELEAAQLPRALDDLDVAVINTNYALPAGLNPNDDALLIEGSESPYVNIVAANPDKAKSADMQELAKLLTSEETAKFISEKYQGAVVPAGQIDEIK